jgi:peptidoglycan hydrolase CwlO-like protein
LEAERLYTATDLQSKAELITSLQNKVAVAERESQIARDTTLIAVPFFFQSLSLASRLQTATQQRDDAAKDLRATRTNLLSLSNSTSKKIHDLTKELEGCHPRTITSLENSETQFRKTIENLTKQRDDALHQHQKSQTQIQRRAQPNRPRIEFQDTKQRRHAQSPRS